MESGDQISLRELVRLLWRSKLLVLSTVVFCTALATVVAMMLPKKYEASVLVLPVSSNSSGSRLSDQISSLGGDLSSLIGMSLGGDSDKYQSLAVLQSRELTEQYIRDNNLLPVLFPPNPNAKHHQWFGSGGTNDRTLWQGAELFSKIRTVTEDRRTGLVTVAVVWTDPKTAASWANGLVRLTNDYLRNQAIQASAQHIDYLKQVAAGTDVAELRTAVYALLESEVKNEMMAKGPGDYALKVLDPAVPPEVKAAPKGVLWVLGGFVAGIFLSVLMLFLRSAWNFDQAAHTNRAVRAREYSATA